MKKLFPLQVPGKADARVVEAIKNEVRKYVKRERKKPLPDTFNTWEFDCRVGADAGGATVTPLKDIGSAIDAIASSGNAAVYIHVLAVPSQRVVRAQQPISGPPAAPPS